MYAGVDTWSPYHGCLFKCRYCRPSFQRQAKRRPCEDCKAYTPHEHPERLERIPSGNRPVFVCSSGDISFCDPGFMRKIIYSIWVDQERKPRREFYLQSKRPEFFAQFLHELPPQVTLVTTLETNRDEGYGEISKAPPPYERWYQFCQLRWGPKAVTVEPVMNFDVDEFAALLGVALNPVWIGYNSRPKAVALPEPSEDKVRELIGALQAEGIEVRPKDLRGIVL